MNVAKDVVRHRLQATTVMAVLVTLAVLPARAELPIEDGEPVVARVEGEVITLAQFERALEETTDEKSSPPATAGEREGVQHDSAAAPSPGEILRRMINRKLIVQEARRIGLDELDEVRQLVASYSRVALRETLLELHVKGFRPSADAVEAAYRDKVREYEIHSLFFANEEDARSFRDRVEGGRAFAEVAHDLLEAEKAKGSADTTVLKELDLRPEFRSALAGLAVGQLSDVIETDRGFVVIQLVDVRYPEDSTARGRAQEDALHAGQTQLLDEYLRELLEKHVNVQRDVFDALDFEAEEPGFDALLEDQHVLATIEGAPPVTVADLARALKKEFYHGIDKAIASKNVNSKKYGVFDELLKKAVMRAEALRLGIDRTASYRNKVHEYEESVLFGAFVRKVASQDVKIKPSELRDYYDEHLSDYATPEMLRINCAVFERMEDAERAMAALRKGAEFSWVRANAAGQVERGRAGLLDCEGKLVVTNDLSASERAALSHVQNGDDRLYQPEGGPIYVLHVDELIPARPEPFEKVQRAVLERVYNDRLEQSVEKWARQLLKASDVKIYWRPKDEDRS